MARTVTGYGCSGATPHYYETRLVRDTLRGGVFLTMDFWESRGAYEEFLERHRTEYEELEAVGEALTVKERRIGWFEMLKGSPQ